MKNSILLLAVMWLFSQETYLFDTASGDMEPGCFAIKPSVAGYLYRDPGSDTTKEGFVSVGSIAAADDPKNFSQISGYIQVHITGKAYYDFFRLADGSISRIKSTAASYTAGSVAQGYVPPTAVQTVGQ